MDEEAEVFVTEMENEEVDANDGVGGQDKKNYVEEDMNVNAEEEWNEDEDVIEL